MQYEAEERWNLAFGDMRLQMLLGTGPRQVRSRETSRAHPAGSG
jgi:hypothetical protein